MSISCALFKEEVDDKLDKKYPNLKKLNDIFSGIFLHWTNNYDIEYIDTKDWKTPTIVNKIQTWDYKNLKKSEIITLNTIWSAITSARLNLSSIQKWTIVDWYLNMLKNELSDIEMYIDMILYHPENIDRPDPNTWKKITKLDISRKLDAVIKYIWDSNDRWSLPRFIDIVPGNYKNGNHIRSIMFNWWYNEWGELIWTRMTDYTDVVTANDPDSVSKDFNKKFRLVYGDASDNYFDNQNYFADIAPMRWKSIAYLDYAWSKYGSSIMNSKLVKWLSWLSRWLRTVWQLGSLALYWMLQLPAVFSNVMWWSRKYWNYSWDELRKVATKFGIQWFDKSGLDRIALWIKESLKQAYEIRNAQAWIQNILVDTPFYFMHQYYALWHALTMYGDNIQNRELFVAEYQKELRRRLWLATRIWWSPAWFSHVILAPILFFQSWSRRMMWNAIRSGVWWFFWLVSTTHRRLNGWKPSKRDYLRMANWLSLLSYSIYALNMSYKIARRLWIQCEDNEWNPIAWDCILYRAKYFYEQIFIYLTTIDSFNVTKTLRDFWWYNMENRIWWEWQITYEQYAQKAIANLFKNWFDIPKTISNLYYSTLYATTEEKDTWAKLFGIRRQWLQRYENFYNRELNWWLYWEQWQPDIYDINDYHSMMLWENNNKLLDRISEDKWLTPEEMIDSLWSIISWKWLIGAIEWLDWSVNYPSDFRKILLETAQSSLYQNWVQWKVDQSLNSIDLPFTTNFLFSQLLNYTTRPSQWDKWDVNPSSYLSFSDLTTMNIEWIYYQNGKLTDKNKFSNRFEIYEWMLKEKYPDIYKTIQDKLHGVDPSKYQEVINSVVVDWLAKVDPKIAINFAIIQDIKSYLNSQWLVEQTYKWPRYNGLDNPAVMDNIKTHIVQKRGSSLYYTDKPNWNKGVLMSLREKDKEWLWKYINEYWVFRKEIIKDENSLQNKETASALYAIKDARTTKMNVEMLVRAWLKRPDLVNSALSNYAKRFAKIDNDQPLEYNKKILLDWAAHYVKLLNLTNYTDEERAYLTMWFLDTTRNPIVSYIFEDPVWAAKVIWKDWTGIVQMLQKHIYDTYDDVWWFNEVITNEKASKEYIDQVFGNPSWSWKNFYGTYWNWSYYKKYQSKFNDRYKNTTPYMKQVYLKDIYPNYKNIYMPKIDFISPKELQYIYASQNYYNSQPRLNFSKFEKQWWWGTKTWQFWWRSSWTKYSRTKYKRTQYKRSKRNK